MAIFLYAWTCGAEVRFGTLATEMQKKLDPRLYPKVYIGLVQTGYLSTEPIESIIKKGLEFCDLAADLPLLVKADLVGFTTIRGRPNASSVHPTFFAAALAAFKGVGAAHDLPLPKLHYLTRTRREQKSLLKAFAKLPPHLAQLIRSIDSMDAQDCKRFLLGLGANHFDHGRIAEIGERAPDRYFSEIITSHLYSAKERQKYRVVYMPKLRSSHFTQGFSGAVRLGCERNLTNIQINAGRVHHNDERLVDMLEVVFPDIIVSDGIFIPSGASETALSGEELGIVIISNNPVAHDLIAAQLMSRDPFSIKHLAIAVARGWSPKDMRQIQIGGATPEVLDSIQNKSRFWRSPILGVRDFETRFNEEFVNHSFSLEVLKRKQKTSTIESVFLEWLLSFYEERHRRHEMVKWPRLSVVLESFRNLDVFPKFRNVCVPSREHFESLAPFVVESQPLLKIGRMRVNRVRLVNGKTYRFFWVATDLPTQRDLHLLFFMASKGRIMHRALFWKYFLETPSHVKPQISGFEPTTLLSQNDWWVTPLTS